jgi:signal transduction histidine kinase
LPEQQRAQAGVLKFRLAHKGLILVLLPLAFEVGLFVWMQTLLHQADLTAQRAEHSREVVGTINLVAADFIDAYKVVSKFSTGAINEKKIQDQIKNVDADVQKLKALRDKDHDKEWAKELDGELNRLSTLYAEVSDLYSRKEYGLLWDKLPKYRQFLSEMATQDKSARILSYAAQEKQIAEEEPATQARLREQTRMILYAWLGIGAILSVLLAIFFAKQISARLLTITDNSSRVSYNQPLNAPVTGTDEIHDLDVAFHDMSEQLKAAKERDKAVQRLRDQVVAMITHDLRTPLEAVSMYVELMGEEPDHPQAIEARDIAERNVERMRRLINDFLDLERLQTGAMPLEKTDFSLSAAVKQARDSVAGLSAQKHVSIETDGDCRVHADEHRIVQVLTNLLGNAIKFSPENSRVKVQVTHDSGLAHVAVIDSGRGIPEDAQQRIFEAFQQTTSADATKLGGSGLGLAICKALIEQHNGTISVTSQVGAGTTFKFTLPL